MEEIIKMAVSALVGTLTVWIVTAFLLPKIAGILSGAAKLHSSWDYKDSETGNVVGTAKIHQFGNRVKVTATRKIDREGKNTNREFVYKGNIAGRSLVLPYEQKDAGGAVAGALVLRLDADLHMMKGSTSYFSDSAGKVITHPIFFYAAV
ncbi:hypothetical protein [Microbulbifer variabilis]|uniref:hypothetical protein n=1 Tax=Microbulbifer variabilis TaxID=266805 RepID=UPI001CFC6E97|nr:hypothetical protein [Microbulbifer variabilis]